jgi:putative MATE family efflux protein
MNITIENFKAESPLRGEIYRLAWPSIVEQLLVMAVGMVSTMFVGQLSAQALVAVGLINMVVMFIQSVFAALSTGTTVVVARLTGEQDSDGVNITVSQSLTMSFICSLVVTLFCYLFADQILALFLGNAEPQVFDAARLYFLRSLISLPFMMISIIMGGALRGAGDTRTPMYSAGVANIVNVILSFVLIFGFGPIEARGIYGAAESVVISRAFGLVVILVALFTGKCVLKPSWKRMLKADIDIIKRILFVGLPASLEQVIMQGGFLTMQLLVVWMGTVEAAVYQIGMSVNSLAFMPIFGLALSATTLVGQNLGANDPEKAEKSGLQTMYISVALISAIAVLMFVFSRELASLYSSDPEVIELGSKVIRIFAIAEPSLAVMNVMSAVLRGAGDIRYIMFTSLVSIWGIRVLLSYILERFFQMGIIGMWYAIFIDLSVRALLYWIRFKAGKWKHIRV